MWIVYLPRNHDDTMDIPDLRRQLYSRPVKIPDSMRYHKNQNHQRYLLSKGYHIELSLLNHQ